MLLVVKSVTTTDDKLEDATNAPGTTPIKEVDFHKVILVHGYIINIVDGTIDNNKVLGRWWQKSIQTQCWLRCFPNFDLRKNGLI